ncbi:MAG TPA: PAS domain-containing protein [Myxococcales bacterium]|nr:PAS domain-containing protein [Myxococcales bacterium]
MGPGKTRVPVRNEGYNREAVSAPSERGRADDPVRVAFDAAEIGAWTWHIGSGRVEWTPRTYQLFGFEPGAVVPSYGLFLGRVHPSDRPRVMEWLAHAIQQGGRTALEFRIERPDGSIRRLRSAGRAMPGADREVAQMAGIVEDVTDQQQRRSLVPAGDMSAQISASFSARQVAHILGIAEASVKRLAEAGRLKLLRSTRKNSRRFAPGEVIEYLRRDSSEAANFEAAAGAQDMSGCLMYLLQQVVEGTTVEALLDEQVRPAADADAVPGPFLTDLLSRLPFIVPGASRTAFPALFAQVGASKDVDAELIVSLLQAHGHEILRPAGAVDPGQLAELAERVRARLLVLAIGSAPADVQASGMSTAATIAAGRHGSTSVCVWCDDRLRVPRGVLRFRSMQELGSALRAF